MRIIIGDRTEKAMKILAIPEYPFTPEELSTKFRLLIKKVHPDVNGSEEAKKLSQEVISSYKLLKNLAISCYGEKVIKWSTAPYACPKCNPFPLALFNRQRGVICNQCLNGVFTLRNGRKVTCRKCKGTGIYKFKCRACNGTGYVGNVKTEFINCGKCSGTGKIKLDLFNPVIPKGAVL